MSQQTPYKHSTLSLTLTAILCTTSNTGWSETVAVTGNSDEAVTAAAIANDLDNSARAFGGTGASANGGDATAIAEQASPNVVLNGDAIATATARGGTGIIVPFTLNSGSGGDATASASARATGDVTVLASAGGGSRVARDNRGNLVGESNLGGNASLGLVYGESTQGGGVSVTGLAFEGDGSINNNGINLNNAVDGNTSGDLSLTQRAGTATFGGIKRFVKPSDANITINGTSSTLSIKYK